MVLSYGEIFQLRAAIGGPRVIGGMKETPEVVEHMAEYVRRRGDNEFFHNPRMIALGEKLEHASIEERWELARKIGIA